MFKNLIEQAKKPKKSPTKKQVLGLILIQGLMLLFSLLVIAFFPHKAQSVAVFIFGSIAISAILYIELLESKNGIGMSEEIALELPKK